MTNNRTRAVAALTVAGVAWGTSVPLSKVALTWLGPGWLTVARFGVAALVLLAITRRESLREAFNWRILLSGAIGWGGTVLVQNIGVQRTSVTHAALLLGAAPLLVAVIAAAWQRTTAHPVAWAGFAVSLLGVGLVTAGHGGGATLVGDGFVVASALLSAMITVVQPRLLAGRDVLAVTAVQFTGAALIALPFSVLTEGMPSAPAHAGPVLAVAALAVCGTLLPFCLFSYGQRKVSAEVAGAFMNLEPLVGAIAGVVAFGDPAGPRQLAGGAAIVVGIALSSLPALRLPVPEAVELELELESLADEVLDAPAAGPPDFADMGDPGDAADPVAA
jgi:O-acetylserine/cysteine efflux transporter